MEQVELGRWPLTLDIPVAWGDMDAFGHVNNAVYLRWFESVRISYFEKTGVLERMDAEKIGPIVARTSVDYRKPVRYPDTVKVSATVLRVGTTSFVMRFRVLSTALGGELTAEGETVVVMMDYKTGQKLVVNPALRTRILALEATGTPPPQGAPPAPPAPAAT
jgi:acyl-CoA thioester hydrolase